MEAVHILSFGDVALKKILLFGETGEYEGHLPEYVFAVWKYLHCNILSVRRCPSIRMSHVMVIAVPVLAAAAGPTRVYAAASWPGRVEGDCFH